MLLTRLRPDGGVLRRWRAYGPVRLYRRFQRPINTINTMFKTKTYAIIREIL